MNNESQVDLESLFEYIFIGAALILPSWLGIILTLIGGGYVLVVRGNFNLALTAVAGIIGKIIFLLQ